MKFWATIGAFFTAILGLLGIYTKGGADARRKQKVKNLKAKVAALEAKDKTNAKTDEDVATDLAEWVRKPDK